MKNENKKERGNGVVICPKRILSLCSGIGGIDIGIEAAINCRTVCYVEQDAFAASVLVARMENAALDPAPIWDDVSTFDGKPWRGIVSGVVAGFPCQPISVAGKRKGKQDDRWIWKDIIRIVREVRPDFVFLENVPGILSMGIGTVLGGLAESGFNAEWITLSAGNVGSPQKRERWFLLAHTVSVSSQRRRRPDEMVRTTRGIEKAWNQRKRRGNALDHSGSLFPPGPNEENLWKSYLEKNAAAEPALCGNVNGVSAGLDESRRERLRALGNSVVPLQAAIAFDFLANRAGLAFEH